MQSCNKISPSHQMQMEIQLHHPLQITQKQTVTGKEIQQQLDQEVCVSLCSIHTDFAMDVCTDHGAEEQQSCLGECLIDLVLEQEYIPGYSRVAILTLPQ